MTVIQLDITAAADPLGTILTTLTDEDVATFSMRKAENSLGAASFTIRRDHPEATAANLAEDNYVRVTIPIISPDPIFGFWLEHHDDTVLAQGEEGAEMLTRQGPGSLAIIGRAAFLDDNYAPAPPASDDRGSANEVAGYWRWQHKQYGQIFVRLIEEGQNEPGVPLDDVTLDFDRDVDSDGVDWPAIDRDVRFEIGTDGLTFMDRFAETGEVFITMDPDLEIHARQARGTDRTAGSFGAGKVRLVKGVNINTELVRSADTTMAATHAIVIGMENNIVQVVSPTYVSGPGKWVTIHYDNSNDTGVLEKVGDEALRRGVDDLQEITMEIFAGDSELTGRYLPFVHFDAGDIVTIHTGTDPSDYNNASERIRAFTISLKEASDDTARGLITGDEMAARSLVVGVECGGAAGTFGIDINVKVEEKGCGGCPEPTPMDCTEPEAALAVLTPNGSAVMATIFSSHGNGQQATSDPGISNTDAMYVYNGATYSIEYLCFHAASSNDLYASLTRVGHGLLGSRPPGDTPGPGTSPMYLMGDAGRWCKLDPTPSDIPTATILWTADFTGYVTTTLDEHSCVSGDSYGSSLSTHITYVSGPDPRFDGVTPPPCAEGTPIAGQEVHQQFVSDGATTSFTWPTAYRAGSMHVKVGGYDWTPSLNEIDPATGPWTLDYVPHVGATVHVWADTP